MSGDAFIQVGVLTEEQFQELGYFNAEDKVRAPRAARPRASAAATLRTSP